MNKCSSSYDYNNLFGYNLSSTPDLVYIDLSNSDDSTINKIISKLYERTIMTHGDILIPENSSQDTINSCIAKYWRPIGPKTEFTSISLLYLEDEILLNKSTKIFFDINGCEPWYGNNEDDYEYFSSDENKVSVDENGTVTGLSYGSANIKLRRKDTKEVVGNNSVNIRVVKNYSNYNVIKFKSKKTPSSSYYIYINNKKVYLNDSNMTYNGYYYIYNPYDPITSIRFAGDSDYSDYSYITEIIRAKFYDMTDMSYMFNYCSSLTSLDLSSWDTSSVTNMNFMFAECSSLTELDLSNWDTSKLVSYSAMFTSVPSTCVIKVGSNFTKTESQTGFSGTFTHV